MTEPTPTVTIERPEKRRLCQHPPAVLCDCQRQAVAAVLARWPPTPAQPPAEKPGRERVVLAEHRVPVVRAPNRHPKPLTTNDERYGDDLLATAGACACVAISVLLIVVLAVRALWLWL